MEDCRETASPRYNSTDAHTHSQLLWQHTSDLYRFEPGRVPAMRRVRRSGFLAQAKGYLQQFPLAKGKSVFSTGVHSTAGPTFRSSFVLASLSYVLLVFCMSLLIFVFGFWFCLKRRVKKNNIKLGGQAGREFWEQLGEGTVTKILKKKFKEIYIYNGKY